MFCFSLMHDARALYCLYFGCFFLWNTQGKQHCFDTCELNSSQSLILRLEAYLMRMVVQTVHHFDTIYLSGKTFITFTQDMFHVCFLTNHFPPTLSERPAFTLSKDTDSGGMLIFGWLVQSQCGCCTIFHKGRWRWCLHSQTDILRPYTVKFLSNKSDLSPRQEECPFFGSVAIKLSTSFQEVKMIKCLKRKVFFRKPVS